MYDAYSFKFLKNIDGLNPGNWVKLGLDDRKLVLQRLEYAVAQDQGRQPCQIEFDNPKLKWPTVAAFYHREYKIYALSILAKVDDIKRVAEVILHEGRHAYQAYSVINPGFHHDIHQVAEWKYNMHNYMQAHIYGHEIYSCQPIEADAYGFSREVVNVLYPETEHKKHDPDLKEVIEEILISSEGLHSEIVDMYRDEFPAIKHISASTAMIISDLNEKAGKKLTVSDIKSEYHTMGRILEDQSLVNQERIDYFRKLTAVMEDFKRCESIQNNEDFKFQISKSQIIQNQNIELSL